MSERVVEVVSEVVGQKVTEETRLVDQLPGFNSVTLVTILTRISEGPKTLRYETLTLSDLETVGTLAEWVEENAR